METIEVDPRVPGNRDEFPSPQPSSALQELDSPSCQFNCPLSPKFTALQEKRIVTIKLVAAIARFQSGTCFWAWPCFAYAVVTIVMGDINCIIDEYRDNRDLSVILERYFAWKNISREISWSYCCSCCDIWVSPVRFIVYTERYIVCTEWFIVCTERF